MRTILATCLLLAGCSSEPSADASLKTALDRAHRDSAVNSRVALVQVPGKQKALINTAKKDQQLEAMHHHTLRFVSDGNGDCKAALPLAVTAALRRWNPSFRLYDSRDYDSVDDLACSHDTKRTPFATSGDWNGDGGVDFMLHGSDGTVDFLVALVAADTLLLQYTSSVITEHTAWPSDGTAPRFPDSYMVAQAPYRLSACAEEIEFDITTESVAIGLSDKGGATVHYLVNGVWKSSYAGC